MKPEKLKDRIIGKLRISERQLIYLTVTAICVLLIMIMNTSNSGDTSADQSDQEISIDSEYSEQIRQELVEIISKIDGVGDVSVMLTMDSSASYVYASDVDKEELKIKSETVIIGNKEALLERIDTPKVSGVLVVCSGGDRAVIREQVIKAVSTVLDIPSSKVYVAAAATNSD